MRERWKRRAKVHENVIKTDVNSKAGICIRLVPRGQGSPQPPIEREIAPGKKGTHRRAIWSYRTENSRVARCEGVGAPVVVSVAYDRQITLERPQAGVAWSAGVPPSIFPSPSPRSSPRTNSGRTGLSRCPLTALKEVLASRSEGQSGIIGDESWPAQNELSELLNLPQRT